jgi:hypothetical protein
MGISKYILQETFSPTNTSSYYITLTNLHIDIEIEIEKILNTIWSGYYNIIPHTKNESMYVDLYMNNENIEEALVNLRFSTHFRKYPPRNGGKPIDIDTNMFIKVDSKDYDKDEVELYPEDFYDEYIWYYDLEGEVIPFINNLIEKIDNEYF